MTDNLNHFDLAFLWGKSTVEFFKLKQFLTGTTVINKEAANLVYEEVFALHETQSDVTR